VGLSSIKKRRLFGFSGHPGRQNYLVILKEDRGLLLPIEAYTAVIAAAVFHKLS
jgi:hypothetical protein